MDQFDFVCISLNERSDRRVRMRKLFYQLGLTHDINWWIVNKHPNGGIYGCFESHYSVWTNPKFNKPYLCVFEDDLRFESPKSKSRFYDILSYVITACPEKFDILNLEPDFGFRGSKLDQVGKDSIHSGFYLHLGCYIIHRQTFLNVAEKVKPLYGMNIDMALYEKCRMAGSTPIFKQRGEDSDIDHFNSSIISKFSKNKPGNSHLVKFNSTPLGWICLKACYLGAKWLTPNYKPELIDRRTF